MSVEQIKAKLDMELQINKEVMKDFDNFKYKDESRLALNVTYYQGLFRVGDAKPTGFGRQVDATGHVYEGMLINGMKHGYGRYIYPDGKVKVGTFESDRLVSGKVYDYEGQYISKIWFKSIEYMTNNNLFNSKRIFLI